MPRVAVGCGLEVIGGWPGKWVGPPIHHAAGLAPVGNTTCPGATGWSMAAKPRDDRVVMVVPDQRMVGQVGRLLCRAVAVQGL